MNIPRLLEPRIKEKILADRRVVVLYGPRQVGKTTLARKLLAESGRKTLELSGDDPRVGADRYERRYRRILYRSS